MLPVRIITRMGLMTLGLFGFFLLAHTPVLQASEEKPGAPPIPPVEMKKDAAVSRPDEGRTVAPSELTEELEKPMKAPAIGQDGREMTLEVRGMADIVEVTKEQDERSAVSF